MNQKSAPTSTTIRTGSNGEIEGAGRDWLVVLGFIVVACVIRLHGLSASNLWLDEANSWQVASGSWQNMLRELRGSPVGPLYFVLLKPWISALGDSAFALRAFSVAASLVLIAVTYALGARLLSRRAAALASALVALSPLEMYFAQEARMYMLTSLLAALCLWSYAVWRTEALAAQDGETRAGTVSLLRYACAAVALLFSNPVAGPLLVAINVDALVVWWRTRGSLDAARSSPRRKATLSWIVAQLAVIAVIVAYAASVRLHSAASSQAWRTPLGLERALREAMLLPFNAISGQHYFAPDFWAAVGELSHGRSGLRRFLITLIVQPLTLLVFVLAGDATIRERWNARYEPQATPLVDSGRRLLLLALLVPLLFCVAISTVRGLEVARYFFYVVPFFMLLLGDGLLRLRRNVRLASFAVLGAAILLGTMSTKASISRDSDYRATAALIEHESQPGDRIMIQPREMGQPMRFYLHARETPIIGLAADARAARELAALPPGRTWVVIDYRSPLYTLAPSELEAALGTPVERDAYTSDASAGVRVALVDTRAAPK
jgi:4-amino-4-deoxy-L-arabinose transferase-like glycosyltransferase